jgi:hypothetical protein
MSSELGSKDRTAVLNAAVKYMSPGDNFVDVITRFGGGHQVVVRDASHHTILIQVDANGRLLERVQMTGAKQDRVKSVSPTESHKRGETLFNPSEFPRR